MQQTRFNQRASACKGRTRGPSAPQYTRPPWLQRRGPTHNVGKPKIESLCGLNDVAGVLGLAPASSPSGDGKALVKGRHKVDLSVLDGKPVSRLPEKRGVPGSAIPVTARPLQLVFNRFSHSVSFQRAEGSVYL